MPCSSRKESGGESTSLRMKAARRESARRSNRPIGLAGAGADDAGRDETEAGGVVEAGAPRLHVGAASALAPPGIVLEIFQFVIIHDAEVSAAEGVGDRAGDFGFGQDDGGAVFGLFGDVLLLVGDGHGAALLGLGLEAALVGFGAIGHQLGA